MTASRQPARRPFQFGAADPPKVSGPLIRLAKPPFAGYVISHNTIGHMTHWLITDRATSPPAGRTVPCTLHEGQCIHCLAQTDSSRSPKWKGWLTAVWGSPLTIVMVEVVERHLQSDERLHPAWQGDLRGTLIKLRRDGTAKTSPIVCELADQPTALPGLPQDLDRVAWLLALWGMTSRAQGRFETSTGEHLLRPWEEPDGSEVPNPPPGLDGEASAG